MPRTGERRRWETAEVGVCLFKKKNPTGDEKDDDDDDAR